LYPNNGRNFASSGAPVKIKLTKKLADSLNGLDLTTMRVGAVIDLDDPLARMLLAERWAEEMSPADARDAADDRSRRRKRKPAGPRGRA
jgi:hypothetical protein